MILSHRDFDHIQGVSLLADAPRFLINDHEIIAASKFENSMFRDINLDNFSAKSIPFGPYLSGKDLYGDGIIYLVNTPGHTVGHISILVRVQDGRLLLTSDAGYSAKSWKNPVIPGFTYNKEQALESLRWIQDFSKRNDCVAVVANHDPSVKETSF